MTKALGKDSTCSIARSLEVLGDSWTLLIIREAVVAHTTRFQDFRDALGIAPNILTKRLALLVDQGLLERRTYREPGERARDEYVLTEAGRSLSLIIAALAEWGRTHRPRPDGTSPRFSLDESGTPAELAFVTADGEVVPPHALTARRTEDARLGGTPA
ncbi:helix-turn-helix transcriptional regulator [Streptomyces sp. SS1-1]|uniref:winged helix-turn-helix transcriptional regulator n=1 Tax=Streptomyces sp. SS1-1 TaxID=2651869 RepID=UPI0012503FE5|nr:helix-turn-helix domain-containing protein [Streptomyces sp. SS1-1]KAB2976902.1 helix-turn-helix transcriptional regulator [Streptomyces sp. SS1-1]